MNSETNDKREISLLLLNESIWKIEEQLNIQVQTLADLEADLLRLKRLTDNALDRLSKLELFRKS